MKRNLALYILINKDIEISNGKLPSQIGHAILRYITSDSAKSDKNLQDYLAMDDNERIIVNLACGESKLKELEGLGYATQRDLGLTELPPNTLTAVCYGVVDRDDEMPKWLKRLRIYK